MFSRDIVARRRASRANAAVLSASAAAAATSALAASSLAAFAANLFCSSTSFLLRRSIVAGASLSPTDACVTAALALASLRGSRSGQAGGPSRGGVDVHFGCVGAGED